jgi:hypothetical protein
MITISEIVDNSGRKVKVYVGLKIGDKLKAVREVIAKDDLGASGLTFDYQAFILGDIYEVGKLYRWGITEIAYVYDTSGTYHFATPEIFELI